MLLHKEVDLKAKSFQISEAIQQEDAMNDKSETKEETKAEPKK